MAASSADGFADIRSAGSSRDVMGRSLTLPGKPADAPRLGLRESVEKAVYEAVRAEIRTGVAIVRSLAALHRAGKPGRPAPDEPVAASTELGTALPGGPGDVCGVGAARSAFTAVEVAGIVVRQARDQDVEPVGRFVVGLSPASRHQRFFNGLPYVSPALIRRMVATAPGGIVLLALDGDTVVGHVMAVRVDEHTVEAGIVVADAYQRRGIGDRLSHELAGVLAGWGVTRLRCDVLSQNHFVLDWLRRLLLDVRFERDGETTTVHGGLPAHAP